MESYVTCRVPGYFLENSSIIFFVVGLIMVEDKMRMLPPFAEISASLAPISESILPQLVGTAFAVGFFKRAPSYNESTDACVRALVPPRVTADNSLPSILIGRPSRVFTTTGQ